MARFLTSIHLSPTCRTLGTPSEESWPGVSKLPDFKPIFPVWKSNVLDALVKPMEEDAIHLLNVSCTDFRFDRSGKSLSCRILTGLFARCLAQRHLQLLFVYDPNRRMCAKDAIKHRYFKGLDISLLPGTKYSDLVVTNFP